MNTQTNQSSTTNKHNAAIATVARFSGLGLSGVAAEFEKRFRH